MKQAIEKFEQHIKSRYPNSPTHKHYVYDLRQFDRLIGKPASAITRADVQRFVDAQLECGRAPTTINRRLAALRVFFEYLAMETENDEWLNPVNWKQQKVKQGKPLPRDISEAEVERLFEAVTQHRDKAMFRLMLDVGLRIGEVVRSQVKDLIVASDGSEGRLRVRGKGGKERFVWLLPETLSVMQAWLEERPEVDEQATFITRRRKGFSERGIQDRLAHYCRLSGVKVTAHQLRHTFGRHMAEAEMPVTSIAALMGHAQISTTQVYIAGAGVKLQADYRAAVERLRADHPADNLSVNNNLASELGMVESTNVWTLAGVKPTTSTSQPTVIADIDLSRYWDALPDWLTGLLREYILHRQREWKPSRVQHNTVRRLNCLRLTWRWLIDEEQVGSISELQRAYVESFVETRLASGVSSGTVNKNLSDLWSFLRYLEDRGHQVNPSVFRVKRPKQGDPVPQFLNEVDFLRLERTMLEATAPGRRDDLLDRTWFYLLSESGLRRGEACDLWLRDIDLAGQRLIVRMGKGKKDRTVPLSSTLIAALRDYLPVRGEADTDHLLIHHQQAINGTLIWNRLNHYGQQAQVEVSPHRLRHTLATRLLNEGMPITSIQHLLGHKQLQTTLVYARIHNETVRCDYERARARLSSAASLADGFFNAPTTLAESLPITEEANYA